MIVYISGRYRHYAQPHNEGDLDLERMRQEELDEARWEKLLWQAGHVPIAPLRLTVHAPVKLPQEVWVERDVDIIEALHSDYAAMLMRPGWNFCDLAEPRPQWYRSEWAYDPSAGSVLEHAAALESEWLILPGMHGFQAVLDELERAA